MGGLPSGRGWVWDFCSLALEALPITTDISCWGGTRAGIVKLLWQIKSPTPSAYVRKKKAIIGLDVFLIYSVCVFAPPRAP